MSRIPAHGAVVVTTTISAVLALCLLGGIEASSGTATATPASPAVAQTAVTTGTGTDDTVSIASAASSLSSSFGVGSAAVGSTAVGSTAVGSTAVGSAEVGSIGAPDASLTSTFDVGESLDTTASVGLAGLAAEGQVPVTTTPAPTADVAAPAPTVVQTTTPATVTGTPREIAQSLASARGWDAAQWTCLDQLWQRESKFQTTIRNSRSGAYGIPQALPASRMASAGADWRTNPITQVQWGLSYISTRYGTGCNAWSHWERHGWY